jgi:hypothetical protein
LSQLRCLPMASSKSGRHQNWGVTCKDTCCWQHNWQVSMYIFVKHSLGRRSLCFSQHRVPSRPNTVDIIT